MKKNPKDNPEEITSSSTKEEVSSFLSSKYKISKEIQENLIKEDISGDILLYLEDNDLKKIGLKIGPIKKITKYIKDNKANFPEKKLEEKIDDTSTIEEVKNFFEKYIEFKGDIDLDGKKLFELKDEDILKLGLSLGQRKKLTKYIKNFKSIIESNKEKEKGKINEEKNNKVPEGGSKKEDDLKKKEKDEKPTEIKGEKNGEEKEKDKDEKESKEEYKEETEKNNSYLTKEEKGQEIKEKDDKEVIKEMAVKEKNENQLKEIPEKDKDKEKNEQ